MITSPEQLFMRLAEQGIALPEQEKKEIEKAAGKYRMAVSDYYFHLIDWNDPDDPIRKQCIPSKEECKNPDWYSADPLNEKKYEHVPFLVHKYRSRAAFLCSNTCYTVCRHCTRKNTVMNEEVCTTEALPAALSYVECHPKINDILITGGDPFALPLKTLETYLAGFYSLPNVNTIRVGTRAIVTEPEKITDELCDMLKKYHPLWVFTQFNHPKEVTGPVREACGRLLDRGIPLGNQSVLLKGINNDADVLEELYTRLIGLRVRPYYLYLCDRVSGTAHFATDYQEGVALVEELRYRLPGYAVPKFVIDAYGSSGGKVTVEKNHVLEETKDYIILQGLSDHTAVKFRR